jgi:hypothetical protein
VLAHVPQQAHGAASMETWQLMPDQQSGSLGGMHALWITMLCIRVPGRARAARMFTCLRSAKALNSGNHQVFSIVVLSRPRSANTILHSTHHSTLTARTTPGFHRRHPAILRSSSMGSAPPVASAFSTTPQLTPVGLAIPYTTSTAGLNKTDASFGSLVRQVGDLGPP